MPVIDSGTSSALAWLPPAAACERLSAAVLLALVHVWAHALEAPPQWTARSNGEVQVFAPADLRTAEVLQVDLYPRATLAGEGLDAWLRNAVTADRAPRGRWIGEAKVKLQSAHLASAQRPWEDDHAKGDAIYSAVSVDGRNVRVARLALNNSPALERHKQEALDLMAQVGEEEANLAQQRPRAERRESGDRAGSPVLAAAPSRAATSTTASPRTPVPAKGYPWVTAQPGKGLAQRDVEAIVHVWNQVYRVTGLQLENELFLLLDDGTVHRGVPVAPEDFDVKASKQNEPKAWGRWRKPLFGDYQFAWPGANDRFETVRHASVVKPAGSNQRLSGQWASTSSAQIGNTSAWSKFSVRFGTDGRFETSRNGAVGGGYIGPGGVRNSVTYDDTGAVTSARYGTSSNFNGTNALHSPCCKSTSLS